jgi:hypothetical protein
MQLRAKLLSPPSASIPVRHAQIPPLSLYDARMRRESLRRHVKVRGHYIVYETSADFPLAVS